MKILSPEACRPLMRQVSGATAFSLNMLTVYGKDFGGPYWSVDQVKATLEWLQDRQFPLGFLSADFTVALPALRIYYDYDSNTGELTTQIDGRLDLPRGLLILSELNPTRALAHLLAHEISHAAWRLWVRADDQADTPGLREFCAICGINPAEWPEDGPWERRLRECGADLIGLALFGQRTTESFPPLTWAQRNSLRAWVLQKWPAQTRAPIEVVGSRFEQVWPIGGKNALRNGQPVALHVAPVVRDGRTEVGLRDVQEMLDAADPGWTIEPENGPDGLPARVIVRGPAG